MELTTEQIKEIQTVRVWALDAGIAEINALQNLVEARTVERLNALIGEADLRGRQANAAWQKYCDTVVSVTGFDYRTHVVDTPADELSEIEVIRRYEGGR